MQALASLASFPIVVGKVWQSYCHGCPCYFSPSDMKSTFPRLPARASKKWHMEAGRKHQGMVNENRNCSYINPNMMGWSASVVETIEACCKSFGMTGR